MVQIVAGALELFVVHAVWTGGRLHFWVESSHRLGAPAGGPAGMHPFCLDAEQAVSLLTDPGADPGDRTYPLSGGAAVEAGMIRLRLPHRGGVPSPSPALARALGRGRGDGLEASLEEVTVGTASVAPEDAAGVLDRLIERGERERGSLDRQVVAGQSVQFFATAARFARHVEAQQRFVPMLRQDAAGKLTGQWLPWLSDERTSERAASLLAGMPPIARAAVDEHEHQAWAIAEGFVAAVVDAECRRTLRLEEMFETVEGRDPSDAQVAWLQGLLNGEGDDVPAPPALRNEIVRRVRRWIGGLEERGKSALFRLLLRLNEPLGDKLPDRIDEPTDDLKWSISFHLQSVEQDSVVLDASDIWLLNRDTVTLDGLTLDRPQELLLGELGRASRIYRRLEKPLQDPEPFEMLLSTKEAYEFLREVRPLLVEQGFAVETPGWWESPTGRLGARLRIESESAELLMDSGPGSTSAAGPQLGLTALVGYHWEIAIGDTTLTLHEFEQFASKSSPLVRINGRWVEIRPEDVQNAIKFIRENPGGQMKLADAMQLAYASDVRETGVPVLGLEATGWVAELFGLTETGGSEKFELPMLATPRGFKGTLRPYQARGLSWLAFLERFGFGACLADDMGLGKTVQMLALLVHEREDAAERRARGEPEERTRVWPTMLVVPMSVIGNWMHETKRFAPELKTYIHHGVERKLGDELIAAATGCDLMVTTYALAHRDRDTLSQVRWGRLVLDEAQNIKNPQAKQSQAVRALEADRRVALTGTPVENRLSELWSIMDFLNPGYLGHSGQFRKRFSVPIERYRDAHKQEQLKGLVRPFILRRVKTDPTIIADLPEKLESREWCHLTQEQARLYESCVKRMLTEVEQTEGIHRRGLVLAALIKLKQICNHPAQMLKEQDPQAGTGGAVDPKRSGKCVRLLEMLDEVFAEGDQALVFTQFRQMGHLLSAMIRQELDREVLFLHGGTPQGQRQKLIEQFQKADGTRPVLLLSLKAGGVGLNLTAATHVFHFDRWWNPAVENQATDRAYRIGQTRTVHVHKFVVRGTLEERVDEMIENKTELAENIIGQGERWLTELDTNELRGILQLRADAIGDEGE